MLLGPHVIAAIAPSGTQDACALPHGGHGVLGEHQAVSLITASKCPSSATISL